MNASAMVATPDYEMGVQRAREALLYAVEGPIADGLARPDVTEVIVDPNGSVWYDMLFGTLEKQPASVSRDRLTSVILGIAGLLGKKVTTGLLEGELPLDGSRIQAWLSPVSIGGPALNIRKRRKQGEDGWPALTLADYEMSSAVRETLDMIVDEHLNLIIVGSTSSGKTTFGGAFLHRISTMYPNDRVVTIEDTEELYCTSESWLPLHSTADVSQRDLLRTGMRARPDRLVVGEVRGSEAIDMVMSMNTGHSGFSTIHGGSVAGGLTRVRQCCRLGGEDTIEPSMVADAIQYGLLMRRVPSGPRTVAALEKVCGYERGRFQLEPVAA